MDLRKQNILAFLEERTKEHADKVALGIRTQFGWKEFTYEGVGMLSRKLGHYLINGLGVKKGEKLAILSESKPEFGACVFGSVLAGMVTVPLDIKLTKYELLSILSDCLPTVMLVSQSYIEIALELKKEIHSIKHIIVMDEPAYNSELTSIYEIPNNYEGKWRHRSSKATALIIYTSGTTGKPKGVEITFRNMFAQLTDLKEALDIILPKRHVTILSILPMNHLFELTVGFSTFLNFGFSVYYTQSLKPKDILSVMRDKQVEFMIVVPAFLKLLKTSIENELANSPKPVQIAFKIMYNIAKIIPSYGLKQIMFKKIHDKFGGRFEGCISGGAPLDIDVGKFFETIGIKVYQGYGLSEAAPVVSVNTDKRNVLASVGRPMRSLQAMTDPQTGELLVRGPQVMKGYHNQPEMTAEVIDEDGWLHTGDVAHIDKDGHIFITGRIKNMIVLSGGKKVLPEEVEAALEASPYFAEVCVLGMPRTGGAKDGTEDIAAVIVPKDEFIQDYDDKTLDKLVRTEIKNLSQKLAAYKRPVTVIIKKEPLPRTSTRKVKRSDVKELVGV
jgi:long-chain acyl-CoA synthetase